MGSVVGDIRHLLGALEWASVSCTKRNGNRVAHTLARYAQNVNVDSYWMEEVPSVAVEYVNIDFPWFNWMFGYSLKKISGCIIRL